jgi:murein DD-endopeptidase MepM/ murein hydrolase activator NlpD
MRWAALSFFVAAIMAALFEPGPAARPSVAVAAPSPIAPVMPYVFSGTSDVLDIPVAGVRREALHSTFNEGRAGHIHHAIDILAPRGTPVIAAVDGRIRKLFSSGAGGLTIYETDPAESSIYYYAHLDGYAEGMAEGVSVHRGDVIGYVGTTGNAPRNTPHLHFAVETLPASKEWWKGEAVDPYPLLMQRGVTVER